MLKWKTFTFDSFVTGEEPLKDALAGMSGKNRVIKFICGDSVGTVFFRVYRDAEQIVDFESTLITSAAPLLPVDIPLAEGQLCKVGFYGKGHGLDAPDFAIGYEETG